MNVAKLKLDYSSKGKNKKTEIGSSDSENAADDAKEFNVKIVNGQIFSVVKTQSMTMNS